MTLVNIINGTMTFDSYKKVIQVHSAIKNHLNIKHIERILQIEGDINLELPRNYNSIGTDYNLLHFAFTRDDIELFKLLLDNHADYTTKNDRGRTVIHRAIEDKCYDKSLSNNQFQNCYIDLVLSFHLKSENSSNLCSNYGISHFHAACMTDNVKAVKFFLKNGAPIQQMVFENSPIFAGFTPLHFAARYSCLQTVEILLRYGANVHSKNVNRKTALNILMESVINKPVLKDMNEKILELLVKHDIVISKNTIATDDFGLSNLHFSCVLKDTSIIERILKKTVDVNQSVKMSSPFCPGYTPLHFAAISNINIVTILIDKKANIEAKDANGVTPFDLCLHRFSAKNICFVLSSKQEWKNIILSDDKTKLLDLVSAMESTEHLLSFIDDTEFDVHSIVPADSLLWPGYTLLHLAVIFSEKTTNEHSNSQWMDDCLKMEECLNEGSKITISDRTGSTALHLAFYLQKRRTVGLLLKHHWTTGNSCDRNYLSHFHIACAAGDQDAVERFLCGDVDVNRPVDSTFKWQTKCHHGNGDFKMKNFFISPGSTVLHINIANGNEIITEMLLDEGADTHAKDVYGFTPIHRLLTTCTACCSKKIGNLLLSINGSQDCVGPGGLSYLHVACHLESLSAIEKLLNSGSDINTPINYHTSKNDEKVYRKTANKDECFDSYGDPSEEPLSFLSCYSGFTPLHFSMHRDDLKASYFLIQKGADIFAKCSNKHIPTPMHEILRKIPSYCKVLIPILMNNDAWRKRVKEEFGLTILHIACCAIDANLCKDLINLGEDVNAQVHMSSIAWAGYTPLHFATTKAFTNDTDDKIDLRKIFELLLDNGADITIANRQKDTALHLLDKKCVHSYSNSPYVTLMLKSIKDFSVNPIDEQGVSFFHIACIKKDVLVVEGYLKQGVDVNQTISYFSERYSGCSSLHLATGYRSRALENAESQIQTTQLLLKEKADLYARDAFDNTPLHEVARCESSREELLKPVIREMSDVNAKNILGETALELLLKTGNAKWEEIDYFLVRGCSLNSYNPVTLEGYISRIFTNSKTKEEYALDNTTLQKFMNSQYIKEVDSNERTCLHNVVSTGYFYIYDQVQLVQQFVDRGCDINHQDNEGRTALHWATLFKNNRGVFALIKNGADVNISDIHGKSAFSYAFEEGLLRDISLQKDYHDPEHVIKNIASHVYKMMLCKLDVSKLNRQLLASSSEKYPLWDRVVDRWNYSKERAKKAKIGSTSMTLYDFLFKVDAEIAYPKMTDLERQEIDDFLKHIGDYKCCAIDYLVKHKINKGYNMLQLNSQVIDSLNVISKRQLPKQCCQNILIFFSIADMKNLIAAALTKQN